MRTLIAIIAVVPSLASAGDFVTGNTVLPGPKLDARDLPVGADPNKYIRAQDHNALREAANDLRAHAAGWLSVKSSSFGAKGDGVTDDTAAIQAAINAASSSQARMVYLPAGIYRFRQLFLHHDATLNPGFNAARTGEVTLLGDGMAPENGGSAGTVLLSTIATGDALVVSPTALDYTGAPYLARDFVARDLTITGGTSGYLVRAAGVPGAKLEHVELVQTNAAGSAIYISTAYFGTLRDCRIRNTASGAKTGDAVTFSTTAWAGLFKIIDSNVSGYAYGLRQVSGGWQSLAVVSSELNATVAGIHVQGGLIDQLTLIDTYWEGVQRSFVSEAMDESRIISLVVTGMWAYGAYLTGPAINLKAPTTVLIQGVYAEEQSSTFLHIDALPAGQRASYTVSNAGFYRQGPASAPFTLFTGIVPMLVGIEYRNNDPNITLHPAAARPIEMRGNYASTSQVIAGRVGVSHLKVYRGVASDIYHNAEGRQGAVDVTNTAPMAFLLIDGSAGIPQGFSVYVKNNLSSTSNLTVRPQSGSVISILAPGQAQWFFFDKEGSGQWF